MECPQLVKKLAAKQGGEHPHGQEEIRAGRTDPAPAID
jgi:hypothetical protein